jgi:hypothetical protein
MFRVERGAHGRQRRCFSADYAAIYSASFVSYCPYTANIFTLYTAPGCLGPHRNETEKNPLLSTPLSLWELNPCTLLTMMYHIIIRDQTLVPTNHSQHTKSMQPGPRAEPNLICTSLSTPLLTYQHRVLLQATHTVADEFNCRRAVWYFCPLNPINV